MSTNKSYFILKQAHIIIYDKYCLEAWLIWTETDILIFLFPALPFTKIYRKTRMLSTYSFKAGTTDKYD